MRFEIRWEVYKICGFRTFSVHGKFFYEIPRNSLTYICAMLVFPEEKNGPTELILLNKHVYRTSTAKDQDKPAITIPFSTLRRVINVHEKQQNYLDINRDIKKRLRDEEDYDWNKVDVAGQIERLKRDRKS